MKYYLVSYHIVNTGEDMDFLVKGEFINYKEAWKAGSEKLKEYCSKFEGKVTWTTKEVKDITAIILEHDQSKA